MGRNQMATVCDTGIMVGLRQRSLFIAHSSVLSLLSLQGGKQKPATPTAGHSSGGGRAGISAE